MKQTREIYISDENYYLSMLIEEDKDEYMKLFMEVNATTDYFESQENFNIIWKAAMARKKYEEHPVEYYVIRVSSKNLHSKHVIEKMGAIPDDSENLFFQKIVDVCKEVLREESYDKAKRQAKEILYVDDEKIYQYKYLPISFLA